MTKTLGRHAVVVGGSIAGLVTARVLSEFFDRVTLVERDAKPESPTPRKGVPQGRHVHAVLAGGSRGLETLFPGLSEELAAGGACPVDFLNEAAFFQHGWFGPAPGRRLDVLFLSRPFLEWHVDRRVRGLPNVEIRERTAVTDFALDAARQKLRGVCVDGDMPELDADLVVDASGRGSRLPEWLARMGFDPPVEEEVRLPLTYTSRIYRQPQAKPRWKVLFVLDDVENNRAGVVFPIEGERWLVTLMAVAGETPAKTESEFLDFAKSLVVPDVYHAVSSAEALTPLATYHFPANLRRHYERCRRFPESLVVIGDAVCSFDPRFGQGMSIAVLEALELQKALSEMNGSLGPLGRSVARKIAAVTELAWAPVVAEDLRHPAAVGTRSLGVRVMQWYSSRIMERQMTDPELKEIFWRVSQFVEPPASLFHPRVLLKVLRPPHPKARVKNNDART